MPLDPKTIKWDAPSAAPASVPTAGIKWDAPAAPASELDATASAYRLGGGGQEGPGYIEQFAGGAKHALDKAAMGAKSLLPKSVQRAGDWVDEKIQGKKVMTPELLEQGKQFVSQTGPASSLGEFAGEALITAPLGGAVGAGAKFLPGAVSALGKVGGGVVGAIGRGAAEGAASNVLMGDPNESVGDRALSGGAWGGGTSGALKLAGKPIKEVGKFFQGKESRGREMLEKSLGGEQAFSDIAERVGRAPAGALPQTTAARAASPELGRLERGARNRGTADFLAHDKAVDKAAWDQLHKITEVPGGVENLKGQPNAIYAEGQRILDKLPLSQNNRASISTEVAKLRNHNEVIANPELGREIDRILGAVDNPNATLGVLPQLYTSLDASAAGSSAIREAKKIIKTVADDRSKGQFSNVLEGYGATKDAVRAAEKSQGLRGVYAGTAGLGEVPAMKSKPLQSGIEKALPDLDPEMAAKADQLAGGLRNREIYKAANSPGSTELRTATEHGPVSAAMGLALPWRTLRTARELMRGLDEPARRKADEALLDPNKFLAMMDKKKARQAALEPWEKIVDEAVRGASRSTAISEE